MKHMIETVCHDNRLECLKNVGQHQIGEEMLLFNQKVGKIETINDIAHLYQLFMTEMKRDKNHQIKKFTRTSEEIFHDKIWSGCSDVGTALAPILRMNGIPTIYIQTAKIDWVKDLQNHNDGAYSHQGHIFLEIYLNDKWMLFDSTAGIIYPDYDYHNYSLPNQYYVFSKSLTGHEVGCTNLENNNKLMDDLFIHFDTNLYQNPNYKEIYLNNKNYQR